MDQLRAGLRDLGYVEGKNAVIEVRWAEGNYARLPRLAEELVRLQMEVIVAVGIKAGSAAKEATKTVPIVLPTTVDVVELGLVKSLARPGENVTGLAFFGPEIIAKRLELLKEIMPNVARTAVLLNPINPAKGQVLDAVQQAAKVLRLPVEAFEARTPGEFEGAFNRMRLTRIEALVIQDDTLFTTNAKRIADLAIENRLASAGSRELGEAGALLGHGVNVPDMYRRSATLVDKILKGARPAELPFERAMRFELIANQRTAKALGLVIPPSVLVRAERIIE